MSRAIVRMKNKFDRLFYNVMFTIFRFTILLWFILFCATPVILIIWLTLTFLKVK